MDKAKTSRKPRRSTRSSSQKSILVDIKKIPGATIDDASEWLLNESNIAQGIWECLKNNDPEGVLEIIRIHLEALNIVEASKNNNIPRSTVYSSLKKKNPTVKTLAKLVNCCGPNRRK